MPGRHRVCAPMATVDVTVERISTTTPEYTAPCSICKDIDVCAVTLVRLDNIVKKCYVCCGVCHAYIVFLVQFASEECLEEDGEYESAPSA